MTQLEPPHAHASRSISARSCRRRATSYRCRRASAGSSSGWRWAVRLAPEGSQIRLAAGREDGSPWVTVADEGPGIPAERQGRIFDHFYRIDKARWRAGSGLGLAIVREIAESHGGRVEAVPEPGRSSAFTIWLPLGAAASGTGAARPAAVVAG